MNLTDWSLKMSENKDMQNMPAGEIGRINNELPGEVSHTMEIGRIFNELPGEVAHEPEIGRIYNEAPGEAEHAPEIGVVFNDAAQIMTS
jgi:hypothetical protein